MFMITYRGLMGMAEDGDGVLSRIPEGGYDLVYNLGFLGPGFGLVVALSGISKVLSAAFHGHTHDDPFG